MEISGRIKLLRIKNSMTQKELSNHLKVSELSVRNWETGVKNPSITAIIALAQIFNVTTDFLLGITIRNETADDILLSKSERALLSNYRTLDKYGRKAVDTLCSIEKSRVESENNGDFTNNIISMSAHPKRYIPKYETPSAAGFSVPLDSAEFEMILADDNVPNEADFAVNIQGNSMYPYIQDGDTVYVKRDCELSIGDVGIFCVDGSLYCKQYYVDKDKNLILVSANPKLKNTNVYISSNSETSVKCYGKVLLDYKIALPDYIHKS